MFSTFLHLRFPIRSFSLLNVRCTAELWKLHAQHPLLCCVALEAIGGAVCGASCEYQRRRESDVGIMVVFRFLFVCGVVQVTVALSRCWVDHLGDGVALHCPFVPNDTKPLLQELKSQVVPGVSDCWVDPCVVRNDSRCL